MDPIAERILSHLKEQRISKSAFSEQSGINKASLSHLESGRNKASLALVEAFHKVFPEVDLHWILTGERSHTLIIGPEPTEQEELKPKSVSLKELSTPPTHQKPETVEQGPITVLYDDGTYRSFRAREASDALNLDT
jgi:transcriptional regulator with XRE-family HTH domain